MSFPPNERLRKGMVIHMYIPETDRDDGGILKGITCFALDMDGTVYLGEKWIEGARDFLTAVEQAGKKYVFLTNNSSKNPRAYIDKLGRMGLEIGPERIKRCFFLEMSCSGKNLHRRGSGWRRKRRRW